MLLGGAFAALPQSDNIIAVAAGGDLQSAIDRAAPGDTITLDAGATFVGQFHTAPERRQSIHHDTDR